MRQEAKKCGKIEKVAHQIWNLKFNKVYFFNFETLFWPIGARLVQGKEEVKQYPQNAVFQA